MALKCVSSSGTSMALRMWLILTLCRSGVMMRQPSNSSSKVEETYTDFAKLRFAQLSDVA